MEEKDTIITEQEEDEAISRKIVEEAKIIFSKLDITSAEEYVPNGYGRRKFSFKTPYGVEISMEEPQGSQAAKDLSNWRRDFTDEQSLKISSKWITRVSLPNEEKFEGKNVLNVHAQPGEIGSTHDDIWKCVSQLGSENLMLIMFGFEYLNRRVLYCKVSDQLVD